MALSFSQPGQKEGSGSATALYRDIWAGEVFRFWSMAYTMAGKYLEKTINPGDGKGSFDRWSGASMPHIYSRGISLVSSSDSIAGQQTKFTEYITRLDDPIYRHDFQSKIDYIMSPSGAQDRMGIVKGLVDGIALLADVQGISAVIQTASMPHPAILPTTHAYITKTEAGDNAGFSSTGGTSDGKFGVDANALLTTTATGADIESELFKFAQYFDNLGVPLEDRYCAMTPAYKYALWRAQGQRVSVDHAGANTVTHPASESLMGSPAGPRTMFHEPTGFTIIPTPHLASFGTRVDNIYNGAAALLTDAGNKYAPGDGFSGVTIPSINGVSPTAGCFEMNQGANNPTDWDVDAKNTKAAWNKVRMVAWHKRAIRRLDTGGMETYVGQQSVLLNDWLLWAKLHIGYGAADPTSACYAVESMP